MAKNEKVNQAFALYKNGKKLKDIADELEIPEGTIRSWKNRYGWDVGKNVATKNATLQREKKQILDTLENGTKETFKNDELTPKEQLFCAFYIKSFNAVQSYMKAFGAKYSVAGVEGYKTLKKPRIKNEIERLKEIKRQQILLSEDDIVEYHMRIAFADIGDFISFGREEQAVMTAFGPLQVKDEKTGKKQTITHMVNVVKLNESDEVDTQLLQEVRQGKDGVTVKLADKWKSLEWLDKYFMFNPMDKHKMEYDRNKYELELLKLEMQIKDRNVPEEVDVDNFIEALNATAREVWSDE